MTDRNTYPGEKLKAINSKVDSLVQEHIEATNFNEIVTNSQSINELLERLCVSVQSRYPVTTAIYSLARQVMETADKCQTGCRFSALLLGHLMARTHCFDQIALCHQNTSDNHIGVIGVHDGVVYHAHFFEASPGYKVEIFTQEKLERNSLFTIDARGIVNLDKHQRMG